MGERGHEACVAAWIERVPRDLSPAQRALLLERAFSALWRRAAMTLGEVTLTAIADRVLHDARARSPELASLRLVDHRIQWQELHACASGLDAAALRESARHMLVEFLTVLGNLTAEILTPALHEELSSVAVEDVYGGKAGPPDERAAPADDDDEGAAP